LDKKYNNDEQKENIKQMKGLFYFLHNPYFHVIIWIQDIIDALQSTSCNNTKQSSATM